MADENGGKTCFVVMGFGQKTDYQSSPQRILDLDSTYKSFIEPSVVALGLNCVRSDEIIHSSLIDKPMFEHLLRAELVIADLSTSNANAIYELGVRHALRPHRTIVIAEEQFKFPFDLNHLNITRYQHLGVDIGNRETIRMRETLQKKMRLALASAETDSPVFIFLPQLLKQEQGIVTLPVATPPDEQRADQSFATLMEGFYLLKSQVDSPGDWRESARESQRAGYVTQATSAC